MTFTILGVDPGKTGALSFIDPIQQTLEVFDMPIRFVNDKQTRSEVDARIVFELCDDRNVQFAFIEDVWSLPTDGHVGAFSFGDAYGSIKGVAASLDLELNRVLPNTWKKNMRAPKDKTGSRERAIQLFPCAAQRFKRIKDDGRAESAMIALYGAFTLDYEFTKPFTLKE